MSEVQKNPHNNFLIQTAVTAIGGFILSILLILIALVILVRFWVFENILYNLFVFCFLSVGVILNIASVNITLQEYAESISILPFLITTPISFFWTVFCVFVPFFKHDLFSQFRKIPMAIYYSSFYDGLGHNPNSTTVHPFEKPFVKAISIFSNEKLLILLMVIFARKLNSI